MKCLRVCGSAAAPAAQTVVPPPPSVPTLPDPDSAPLPPVVTTLPPPAMLPPTGTPPVVIPVRPMTVNEFVAAFKPLPGKYEVLLIHPKTGVPVKVHFALPPGCIRTVRVTAHKIAFVYAGRCDVVIRFLHSGKVWVRG